MKIDFTFIIPWADRFEIQQTLTENVRFLRSNGILFELFIINCGGDFSQLQSLLSDCNYDEVTLVDTNEKRFNKSKALNKGIRLATATYFVCLDADIIFQTIDFKESIRLLEQGNFITLESVVESDTDENIGANLPFDVNGVKAFSYKIEFELTDGTSLEVVLNRNHLKENSRSAPGILIAPLHDLKSIEGYNSELEGWGWEDIDLIVRLTHYGLKRMEMGSAIHLTHKNQNRDLDPTTNSKSENEAYNFQKCLINYQLGLFKGTLIRDTQ